MTIYFKFIKFYNTTEPTQVIDLFFSLYQKPEILITITGSANLNLSPQYIKTICKGIIKAASSTSKFYGF